YVTHVRDESGLAPENIGVMKAYQEAINIGKASGVAVHFSHMKITAPYHGATAVKLLEMVDKAREEGVDITGDQYPYDFFSTNLEIFLPQNYLTSIGVKPEYRTGEGKTEIIEVIKQYFAQISQGQVSSIVVFSSRPSYNRKSLGEIARTLGKSLAEAYIEVITETDDTPFGIFFFMREDDMKEFMKKEYVFTVSDGFAMSTDVAALFPNLPGHPRSFGAFPRKIRKYALDEQVIPLQQAIRSMTSLPAERFHMKKRGRIAQGYYADITILDLKKLKDTATYQNYAQYAEGIEYLLVNGQLEIDQETITGIRSGRFLKMGD
ncbi:MAG: amidohydrolase family protein, partial [Candidatus Atribacteria bacterium]|nr:amidohydrolase family protein [Candidatus Atribacteria bacterium]